MQKLWESKNEPDQYQSLYYIIAENMKDREYFKKYIMIDVYGMNKFECTC